MKEAYAISLRLGLTEEELALIDGWSFYLMAERSQVSRSSCSAWAGPWLAALMRCRDDAESVRNDSGTKFKVGCRISSGLERPFELVCGCSSEMSSLSESLRRMFFYL